MNSYMDDSETHSCGAGQVSGSNNGKSSDMHIESYCLQPYYEYLIVKLFMAFNSQKRGWLRYIEVWSILLLQKLDRLNSQFKFLNVYE